MRITGAADSWRSHATFPLTRKIRGLKIRPHLASWIQARTLSGLNANRKILSTISDVPGGRIEMRCTGVRMVLAAVVILGLPFRGYSQEATLSGSITDATGGVLPGVTVTALHEASGNTFLAVTDERGSYRLPLRTGNYTVTVELA